MPIINSQVKPFKATAYKNGNFVEVSDADLKGKWSVVFFYPADFTFVCPTELEDLADNYAEFQKLGVEIYSVSTDTHFAHAAWHNTSPAIGKIQYTMIGDPTLTISRNFDVLIEEAGLADRGTFVINPEGQIKIVELNDGGVGRDASELLRKIKAAQYVAATQAKCAQPSGKKARPPWRRPWTWSARSKSVKYQGRIAAPVSSTALKNARARFARAFFLPNSKESPVCWTPILKPS
jgi:peroxiredoxin (alkyl hydroperoxide reductase subunit C)